MENNENEFETKFEFYLKKNFYHLNLKKSKLNIVRVEISINSIYKFNPILAKLFFSSPERFLFLAENLLNKFIKLSSTYTQKIGETSILYKINLLGPFGHQSNLIRFFGADCLGELIHIEGSVVFYGKKTIKRSNTVFFCEKNSKLYSKTENYEKFLPQDNLFKSFKFSNMEIEHGLSSYFEQQKIILFENNLKNNAYNHKQYLNVYLKKDLVDHCFVGDEIEVCGILKPIKLGDLSENFGLYETCLSAISIKKRKCRKKHVMNKLDFLLINYFSMFSDCFERLSSLIAPQLQGIELIKKGILMSLVYSNSKTLPSMVSKRENINLLLVGDNNVVKYEIFSFVSNIFKICSISKYNDLLYFQEDKNLEGGKKLHLNQRSETNMLLLKNNFVYFDNLEELSYRDKISIGELIKDGLNIIEEQSECIFIKPYPTLIGWVKIKKKGFDYTNTIQKNINFPDSLYNQFDLPLILPDRISILKEKTEAKIILNNHRFSNIKSNFLDITETLFSSLDEILYFDKNIIKKKSNLKKRSPDLQSISVNFLNNYIHYARLEVECFLSKEVVECIITDHYSSNHNHGLCIKNGIEMIETSVKLCLAFTRCHLREFVSIQDVYYVINFLNTVYNEKSQLKLNRHQCYSKKIISCKKTKNSIIYSIKKDEIGAMLVWKNFKMNNPIFTDLVELIWNFKKIHITSFFIKSRIIKNGLHSLTERALSKWIYKNICIVVGKDIISV
jgi:DNA replicative helicase MCM subunit Mcm2 (Cdc46/Mcm family)